MKTSNFEEIKKSINRINEINEKSIKIEGKQKVYDSSISEFGSTFMKTLPKEYTISIEDKKFVDIIHSGEAFRSYIEETLSAKKSYENNLSAVEFGGPGSNLFRGFTKNFFSKTIGISLDDTRTSIEKETDELNNHSVIAGNIFDLKSTSNIYEKINQKLQGGGVDLIISRMMGPLFELKEKNPIILNKVISKWYKMLNENGLIFAQFEYFFEHDSSLIARYSYRIEEEEITNTEKYVKEWVDNVTKQFPEIEIQLGRGVLRLHKNYGAPKELL